MRKCIVSSAAVAAAVLLGACSDHVCTPLFKDVCTEWRC